MSSLTALVQEFRPCKVCTPEFLFAARIVNQSTRSVTLQTPRYFSFKQILGFLGKFPNELLFSVHGKVVYRLYEANRSKVLVAITSERGFLKVRFLNAPVMKPERLAIIDHIWTWFDLQRDLQPFYEMANSDKILSGLASRYKGLRLIRIPDLFEAVCWAIIGQQVNLSFAFTVKERFIKKYGSSLSYDGGIHYSFPRPEQVVKASLTDLRGLQLSQRKAEYILEVANKMSSGGLSANDLRFGPYEKIFEKLTAIRGIGPWTADYVLMKTFGFPQAFPVGDAGLQNAVKAICQLKSKPSEKLLRKMAAPWAGWESYSTFYLWRYLYGD